ncbi:sequestosome-1-like [Paramacrobiotus metropolitanus]|uniref:sequestosome-1-like n=1 Tax=Paramacrobiotus metropolitanus TaxID=2943436 RepID=UPI0024464B0A|nr:sequestosome-1-like [Paramacrobiotus metropolitanus]
MPHVKVVYESEGEIRRYLLPSGAGAFEELRSKIRAVLGPNVSFRIFWKDAEGDTVACDSDVELQAATEAAATTETPSDAVKLYVRITGTTTPTASASTASIPDTDAEMKEGDAKEDAAAPDNAGTANVHRGIYCDGCQGPVAGIRYKCKKCENYDLCETCKGKSFHAEHEMDAIPFKENTGPKVHVGVECDGCEGEVAGTRYKCTQCFNYDLCETCKGKGFHAEHEMIAVQEPEFPPHTFGFGFPFMPWNRPAAGGCHRGRRGNGGCGRFPGMQGFGRPMWQGMGGDGGFTCQGQAGRCGRESRQGPLTPEAMDEVARQLQAMGIQADGGILRELIEQFHGDIAKIIEAMN